MKQLFIIISFYLISLGLTSQVKITLETAQTTGGTQTACQTITVFYPASVSKPPAHRELLL